jgi:Zn-dependent protease
MLLLNILLKAGIFEGLFLQFIVVLMQLNILLAIFNLIPVPPLDGSKILMSFLSDSYLGLYRKIEQYAPIILLVLIFTGAFRYIINPLYSLVINIYSLLIGLLPGF